MSANLSWIDIAFLGLWMAGIVTAWFYVRSYRWRK